MNENFEQSEKKLVAQVRDVLEHRLPEHPLSNERIQTIDEIDDFLSEIDYQDCYPALKEILPILLQAIPNLSRSVKDEVALLLSAQVARIGTEIADDADKESHYSEMEEILLDDAKSASLPNREIICKSLAATMGSDSDNVDAQSADGSEDSKERVDKIIRKMGQVCDGIPQDWQDEFIKHAEAHLLKYANDLFNGMKEEDRAITAAVLTCVKHVCDTLNVAEEDMIEAMPFLVRATSARLCDGEKWEQSTFEFDNDLLDKKEVQRILTALSDQFFPRARETIELVQSFNDLLKEHGITEIVPDGRDCLTIDGEDLVVLKEHEGNLKNSRFNIFIYDLVTGYARGNAGCLPYAVKRGSSDKPLGADDAVALLNILDESSMHGGNQQYGLRDGEIHFLLHRGRSEEAFQEIMEAVEEIKKFRETYKGMPDTFFIRDDKKGERIDAPSYEDLKLGLEYHSEAPDPEALKLFMDKVIFRRFQDVLEKAPDANAGETANIHMAKQYAVLHPSNDGSGRVSRLLKMIGSLQVSRQFGLVPVIGTAAIPSRFGHISAKTAADEAIEDRQIANGDLKLVDVPSRRYSSLSMGDVAYLDMKFPKRRRKGIATGGWQEGKGNIDTSISQKFNVVKVAKKNEKELDHALVHMLIEPGVEIRGMSSEIPKLKREAILAGHTMLRFKPLTPQESAKENEEVQAPKAKRKVTSDEPSSKRRRKK